MIHSSGAAATSVEICAVTAISSPDGTADTNTQRPIVSQLGFATTASSSIAFAAADGARSSRMAQAAITATRSP